MNRLRSEAGYSLTEMVVVIAILGIVLGGLTTIFVSGTHAEMDTNARFQAQQNARLALSRIRSDAHLAGCTGTGTGATSISFYSIPATPGSCTGTATVTWCTAGSPSLTGRWALYRQGGGTCSASTGLEIADYLTTNALFTTNVPTTGSGQRASVTVTFPVSTNKTNANLDLYTLKDTLVLRNAPEA